MRHAARDQVDGSSLDDPRIVTLVRQRSPIDMSGAVGLGSVRLSVRLNDYAYAKANELFYQSREPITRDRWSRGESGITCASFTLVNQGGSLDAGSRVSERGKPFRTNVMRTGQKTPSAGMSRPFPAWTRNRRSI